jgi:hypothetical protein
LTKNPLGEEDGLLMVRFTLNETVTDEPATTDIGLLLPFTVIVDPGAGDALA